MNKSLDYFPTLGVQKYPSPRNQKNQHNQTQRGKVILAITVAGTDYPWNLVQNETHVLKSEHHFEAIY